MYKFHINSLSASAFRRMPVKRESGENPERSGHCIEGAVCKNPLYVRKHMRRNRTAMISKSGNLLKLHKVEASE